MSRPETFGSGAFLPPGPGAAPHLLGSGAFTFGTGVSILGPAPSAVTMLPFPAPLTATPPRADLSDVKLEFAVETGAQFPDRDWDPYLLAQAVVIDFCRATDWRASIKLNPPDDSQANLQAEMQTLVALAAYRPQLQAEILTQATDPFLYFSFLLNSNPATEPKLWELIATVHTIAQLAAMHFKKVYKRARPVQVYPAIMPLLNAPPHASYPNSHALQTGFVAAFLGDLIPGRRVELQALATRIAILREVAGVHFPSDRQAAVTIIEQLKPLLAENAAFKPVFESARAERGRAAA